MTGRHPYQPLLNPQGQVAEAKYLYDILLGKMLQPEPHTPNDRVVPYLRAANIQWAGVRTEDIANMYASPREIDACSVVPGDLLVCEGGEVGRAAVCPSMLPPETIIQNAVHRVRVKNGNSTRYLGYLLRHIANSGWFDVLCNKATIAHFTVEKFGDLLLGYPSPKIQESIADFLDKETSRLDSLLGEKQRFLNLLAEKRRTLIASSITQGLNRDAQRRDSGIPWLGEIPAHWNILRAKVLFREIDERSDTGEEVLLSLRITKGLVPHNDVSEKVITPADLIGYKKAWPQQIVINRMRAASGLIAVVPQAGLVSPDYAVFESVGEVNPEFFTYLFQTPLLQAVFRSESKGLGTGQSGFLRLYSENFLALHMPAPPIEEQKLILQWVQTETKKIDDFAQATERTITLLQERRSALISAAVTGQLKIDVSASEVATA